MKNNNEKLKHNKKFKLSKYKKYLIIINQNYKNRNIFKYVAQIINHEKNINIFLWASVIYLISKM